MTGGPAAGLCHRHSDATGRSRAEHPAGEGPHRVWPGGPRVGQAHPRSTPGSGGRPPRLGNGSRATLRPGAAVGRHPLPARPPDQREAAPLPPDPGEATWRAVLPAAPRPIAACPTRGEGSGAPPAAASRACPACPGGTGTSASCRQAGDGDPGTPDALLCALQVPRELGAATARLDAAATQPPLRARAGPVPRLPAATAPWAGALPPLGLMVTAALPKPRRRAAARHAAPTSSSEEEPLSPGPASSPCSPCSGAGTEGRPCCC